MYIMSDHLKHLALGATALILGPILCAFFNISETLQHTSLLKATDMCGDTASQ